MIILLVLVCVLAITQAPSCDSFTFLPATQPTTQTTTQPTRVNLITMEKYLAVKDGMTYKQVAELFGMDGEESARSSVEVMPGKKAVHEIYTWKNRWGSNALITFQDGRVVMKAQAGLK